MKQNENDSNLRPTNWLPSVWPLRKQADGMRDDEFWIVNVEFDIIRHSSFAPQNWSKNRTSFS